jgi:cyclic 2,3-diphosphoglycerate synthetase
VQTDARILVSGRGHDLTAFLNPYRVLVSDLVVLVGGGDADAVSALKDVPVLTAELRLRPVTPLHGRRVAVFTTGPALTDSLDADVVTVSRNLANRPLLSQDLAGADANADVYLVEIKAAAIDLVAETALKRGAEVVFAENEVVCAGLDEAILDLIPARAHA